MKLLRTTFRLALAAAAMAAAAGACSSSAAIEDPCPGDDTHTIGEYCDEILPAFCRHAVLRCGASGTVEECQAASRAICCQGGCGRLVCTPRDGVVDACIQAYSGEVGDAGFPDGGMGYSCASVTQGFAPSECRSIVQLKSEPMADITLRGR